MSFGYGYRWMPDHARRTTVECVPGGVMRKGRQMLGEVNRAIAVAFLFSGCIALLALALPLYIVIALDAVLASGTIETLVLAAPAIALALLAAVGLELARERCLARAGIWLGHMHGRHQLETGLRDGRTADEMTADAQALARVVEGLKGPHFRLLLDLPWLPLTVAAVALLHPALGGLLAGATVLTGLAALLQMRLTAASRAQAASSHAEAEAWRQAGAAGARTMTPDAVAAEWDSRDRGHVAAAWREGRRTALVRAAARLVLQLAQLGLWGLGAWLAMRGAISAVALVAAACLVHRCTSVLEAGLGSLGEITALRDAHRQLKRLATESPRPAVDAEPPAAHPHATVGPVRLVLVGGRAA